VHRDVVRLLDSDEKAQRKGVLDVDVGFERFL